MERETEREERRGRILTSVFRAHVFVLKLSVGISHKMDHQNVTNNTSSEGYAMEVIFREHRPVMAVICSSSLTLGLPLAINMLSHLKVLSGQSTLAPAWENCVHPG